MFVCVVADISARRCNVSRGMHAATSTGASACTTGSVSRSAPTPGGAAAVVEGAAAMVVVAATGVAAGKTRLLHFQISDSL